MTPLIGKHAFQSGLVGWIGQYPLMQFFLAFVRFRGQDMPCKGVTAHHFARARLLEPLSRTFMGLEFRHGNSVDLFEQVRLKNYSIAGRTAGIGSA